MVEKSIRIALCLLCFILCHSFSALAANVTPDENAQLKGKKSVFSLTNCCLMLLNEVATLVCKIPKWFMFTTLCFQSFFSGKVANNNSDFIQIEKRVKSHILTLNQPARLES